MIKQNEIKSLMDGEREGQAVYFIVQAPAAVIPTAVLNVYGNLNMEFVAVQASLEMPKTNLTLNQQSQPKAILNFIFRTTRKNYEKIFGPYHPAKVLEFKFM